MKIIRGQRAAAGTAGFTLVEMLIVLVLVGLLAGSVVVSLDGRQELYGLRTAAKDLAAAASFAAREARLSGQIHRLVIDADGHFAVERLAADGSGLFEPVDGLAGRSKALPRNVWVSVEPSAGRSAFHEQAGQNLLMFSTDGSGFDGELLLRRDSQSVRIRIAAVTGQVQILE